MVHEDTICAIATPPGPGGIGIVRVSGPSAVPLCERLVRLRCGGTLAQVRSHRLQLADIFGCADPQAARGSESGRPGVSRLTPSPLDTGLVTVMRGPHSYTGEDVVELQCHGGPLLLRRICESLMAIGVRLAEPGEFTKRAFLNGRLDLTQAEGVLDTIQARTEASLRVAQELMRGRLSSEVEVVQASLIRLLAQIEAGIDFVEEDIAFVTPEEVTNALAAALRGVNKLLDSWEAGRLLREGTKVVLVGKPNVGKSSLLNALLKADRAIVTPIPGTTRDVLEETIAIEGIPIRLVDTAGVRETLDPVELEGVRRTRQSIDDADVVLVVLDGSAPLDDDDRRVVEQSGTRRRVFVMNKADCAHRWSDEARTVLQSDPPQAAIVTTSARTGLGIEVLRRAIVQSLPRGMEAAQEVFVTRLRHREALGRAREALLHAQDAVADRLSSEFVAMDLRAAVSTLGELLGEVTTDDLLDRIFSEFCIGK